MAATPAPRTPSCGHGMPGPPGALAEPESRKGAAALKTAPVVDATRPLRREHELTICSHYGIGGAVGRAAEVASRPEGEVTAVPLGSPANAVA